MEDVDTVVTVLPNSLLSQGQWAFEASFRVHDGYGRMSGSGNGIDDAVRAAFEDCCDGNLDEAGEPDDWEVESLTYEGNPILEDTLSESQAAREGIVAFIEWGDVHALEAAVRRFQRAEAAMTAVNAMAADLCWVLAVRNGGCTTLVREDGRRRWAVVPRQFHGNAEPCVPPFLLK